MLLMFLFGVVIGCVMGFIGVGGGIFVVLVLVFGLYMLIIDVGLIGLLVVGIVVVVGVVVGLCKGIVCYKVVLLIVVIGVVFMLFGIWLVYWFDMCFLSVVFVLVLLCVVFCSLCEFY